MATTYCVNADIDQVFGPTNVTLWADLDNDSNAANILARKDEARNVAYDRINDVIRCTSYTVPLRNQAAAVPGSIKDLEARLAGVWLYEARGCQDFSPKTGAPYHRLAFVRAETRRTLEEIRVGHRIIDAI